MNTNDLIQTSASVATAVGVLLAWWQIRTAKDQSITLFEDELTRQYREIAATLPVEALLGEPLNPKSQETQLTNFYRYIDLTNEQVFLRQRGRVRPTTWINWADGIQSHLARPAFREAWKEIMRRAPDSFTELRRLEKEDFQIDPRKWKDAG